MLESLTMNKKNTHLTLHYSIVKMSIFGYFFVADAPQCGQVVAFGESLELQ